MRTLHGPQKDDTFQIGYVHSGGKQIHRDNNARCWTIAELADMLKRTIHLARDLLSERIASTEDVTSKVHKLVGVRRVRQVIGGEDQRLREATILFFVIFSPLLYFFENLLVGIGRCDLALDLRAVKLTFIF